MLRVFLTGQATAVPRGPVRDRSESESGHRVPVRYSPDDRPAEWAGRPTAPRYARMATLGTILITTFAVTIVLAPNALEAWLARRDAVRASRQDALHEESLLGIVTGGAD